ncbi:g8648 [Coccomyxa elongata]
MAAFLALMGLLAIMTPGQAQTTIPIKTILPTNVVIKNNGTAALIQTSTFFPCNVADPDPEHCSEVNQQTSALCQPNADFNEHVVQYIADKKISWDGRVKQNENGTVTVEYTFGSLYASVIKNIAVSGTNYKYVRSSLLFVQDQTTTQPPPYMFDTMVGKPGFVDPAGSDVTVTLTTESKSTFVPNIGLRFDFTQDKGSGTPSCSLFFSDRFDSKLSAINGLKTPNLVQFYDLDILKEVVKPTVG